jgi:hypothetical protein
MMAMPTRFHPLKSKKPHPDSVEASIRFLTEIWDYNPMEYTFLCTRHAATGSWTEHAIRGDRPKKLEELFEKFPADTHDSYFCPNSFYRPSRKEDQALGTRYAWSDIDNTDPASFKPQPNILWESSAGSFQGLWIWHAHSDGLTAQLYAKGLWKRYGGDKGGWSVTKLLRVPGTINHKPERNKDRVRLVRFDPEPRRLPKWLSKASVVEAPISRIGDIDPLAHDPVKIMKKYRRSVGLVAGTLMMANGVRRGDRSGCVFLIASAMMKAGATDHEVASVLWVNPYFISKWGRDLGALENEIVRIRGRSEVAQ